MIQGTLEVRECRVCGNYLPMKQFEHHHGSNKVKRWCDSCCKEDQRTRYNHGNEEVERRRNLRQVTWSYKPYEVRPDLVVNAAEYAALKDWRYESVVQIAVKEDE